MNNSLATVLCFTALALSAHTAMAHPAGHQHAPCDHMGDSKMMQKHLEEHHKEGAAKTTESRDESKASPPASATTKPAPKPSVKPVP